MLLWHDWVCRSVAHSAGIPVLWGERCGVNVLCVPTHVWGARARWVCACVPGSPPTEHLWAGGLQLGKAWV